MPSFIERALEAALADRFHLGQILVEKTNDGFVLSHRDDEARGDLRAFRNPEDAVEIAKYDDAGNYRPLKTAPSLQRGWRLKVATLPELTRALDYFYPGRLAVFAAWKSGKLQTTPLRETLDRQSGMYRIAARISDKEINDLAADFCRSNGRCLRTILWKRDQRGTIASTKLPKEKFDPAYAQAEALGRPGSSAFAGAPAYAEAPAGRTADKPAPAKATIPVTTAIPLLCQEACNLLVSECRKVVKGE